MQVSGLRMRCGSQLACRRAMVSNWIAGEVHLIELYHWSITHTTFSLNCRGINLCNACVSLASACLASMMSQKGNYTTIMLGELISNYTHTHTSYTSLIVGELIV